MMKQYQLWYDAPAKDWNIALPLGNGRMGAMVFGGTVLERISLNEDSCWYGGFRDRVNPDAKKYLPVVRQLLKEDRIAEAQQLAEEALTATPDGERHYEVLCDLILQQLDGETPEGLHGMRNLRGQDMSRHERPVSGYRRALDITDGVHQVSYVRKEKQIRREPMDVIYSIWSARDILKGQIEVIIQSMLPSSTYSFFQLIHQNRHECPSSHSFRHRAVGPLSCLPSPPGNEP